MTRVESLVGIPRQLCSMGVSQTFIFVLTFLIIAVLVVLVKIKRMEEKDVAIYSFGYKEFEEEGNDEQHDVSGILHISQVIKKAETDGDLTVVNSSLKPIIYDPALIECFRF